MVRRQALQTHSGVYDTFHDAKVTEWSRQNGYLIALCQGHFCFRHLERRSWACPTSRRLELCVGDVLLIQLCKPSMA